MQTNDSRITISWRFRLAAIFGFLLVAMAMAGSASAQTGITGDYCVQDYRAGANCTAEDVRIGTISPDLSDVCLLPGDTAQVEFTLELITGATTRYDIGMFIATDGGSALSGNSCYHDYLNPAGGVFNANGGPFRNIDGDTCADTLQADGSVYYVTDTVTITCVDNDNNGVVDDISTCTSWDNNAGTLCNDVSQAFPGTNSKCKCEDRPTNTILYQGLDWGDLPAPYPTLNADSGAYHAVQRDTNSDGKPDTSPTTPPTTAVWLGTLIDLEADGQPNAGAVGDTPDEDGVVPTIGYDWSIANGGSVDVTVSRSDANACTPANPCKLAMYFDWDEDGVFGAGEETITDVVAGANTETFPISGISVLPSNVYSRFRLYRVAPQSLSYLPTGLVQNGEVEDYKIELTPLGVVLLDFSVVCTGGRPEISWETASELYTQGFNVWRNTTSGGPQNKLNATMIPGHPGSSNGYTYSYLDTTAAYNTTYYFWLEDIDTSGVSTFNGPISVECQAPTSVGFDTVEANPAAGLPVGALPAAGLLALGAAGAAAVWLKRRRA